MYLSVHWDGSFEYPQHMFGLRNKKKIFFCYTLLTKGLPLLYQSSKGSILVYIFVQFQKVYLLERTTFKTGMFKYLPRFVMMKHTCQSRQHLKWHPFHWNVSNHTYKLCGPQLKFSRDCILCGLFLIYQLCSICLVCCKKKLAHLNNVRYKDTINVII